VKIWHIIPEETRKKLIAYQNKHHPMVKLTPPVDDEKPVNFALKLEDAEEIGKIMRKRPKRRRDAKKP
jgi:hypothetical protein